MEDPRRRPGTFWKLLQVFRVIFHGIEAIGGSPQQDVMWFLRIMALSPQMGGTGAALAHG